MNIIRQIVHECVQRQLIKESGGVIEGFDEMADYVYKKVQSIKDDIKFISDFYIPSEMLNGVREKYNLNVETIKIIVFGESFDQLLPGNEHVSADNLSWDFEFNTFEEVPEMKIASIALSYDYNTFTQKLIHEFTHLVNYRSNGKLSDKQRNYLPYKQISSNSYIDYYFDGTEMNARINECYKKLKNLFKHNEKWRTNTGLQIGLFAKNDYEIVQSFLYGPLKDDAKLDAMKFWMRFEEDPRRRKKLKQIYRDYKFKLYKMITKFLYDVRSESAVFDRYD